MACSVAQTVLSTIEEEQLLCRATELGDRVMSQLKQGLADNDRIVDVRGQGLMIGIEMSVECAELVGMALERGLLINVTAGRVIRLLPALNMTDDDADELVTRLLSVIRAFHNR